MIHFRKACFNYVYLTFKVGGKRTAEPYKLDTFGALNLYVVSGGADISSCQRHNTDSLTDIAIGIQKIVDSMKSTAGAWYTHI